MVLKQYGKHSGVVAERQTASRDYLKYALNNVKWVVHPLSNL